MTPGFKPRSRTAEAKSAASATVATIGAITQVSVPVVCAAAAMPSSCLVSSSGLSKERRKPRTPSAGFSSPLWVAKATGLSEPASSVRTTTYLPPNGSSTSP
jgi:hypothetical protein